MTPPPPNRVGQAARPGILVRTLPEDLIPERDGVAVWLGNGERQGEWILPRAFRTFAFMADIKLDLTSARMGSGISEMEINCILAEVTVTVPPDIRIVCDGDAMGGSFDVKRIGYTDPPVDAPTLRISGTAYLAEVTIKIVDPNAPRWTKKLKSLASLKG